MEFSLPEQFRVSKDKVSLSHAVASEIVTLISRTLKERDCFSIAMAGGSTPKLLYSLLAHDDYRPEIPWENLLVFWGDERYVPHDDEKSNYRMTKEALLDNVPIPEKHIFPMPTTHITNPHDAATAYAITLRNNLTLCGDRFDLILLGMGDDGHTASLFPGSPALEEQELQVVAAPAPVEPKQRITLTYPSINAARCVYFLVSGENKAEALDCVLNRPSSITACPSKAVQPSNGTITWWVDEAAAHRTRVSM